MRRGFIDRYAALDSPLHLLEARSKLAAFAALIISVLCIPTGRGSLFFIYFFAAAILMGISQIPLNYIVGRTLLFLPFITLAGLTTLWKDYAGFWILLVRGVLVVILILLFINTTRFVELLHGLRRMGFPKTGVLRLNFLYLYFFALTQEAARMKQAIKCRRVGRSGLVLELKRGGFILKTFLICSAGRAMRMHWGMLSRAYDGDISIPSARKFSLGDLVFLWGVTLFITLTFLML